MNGVNTVSEIKTNTVHRECGLYKHVSSFVFQFSFTEVVDQSSVLFCQPAIMM